MKDITFTTIIKQWQHSTHTCFTMLFTHKQDFYVWQSQERTQKNPYKEQITHFIRLSLSCFLLPQIGAHYYSFQFDYSQHVYGYHTHTLHTVNNLTETIANWILNVFNAALKLIRWNVLFVVSKWIDHLQAKNHYTIEAHHIVMHRHGSAPTHNSNLRARVALACSCSCSCICKLNWKNTLLVYVNYVCMFVYSSQ